MTVAAELLNEAQTRLLEKHKAGFTPNFAPLTPEELMREAAEEDAGRGLSMTVEEVEAAANALYG